MSPLQGGKEGERMVEVSFGGGGDMNYEIEFQTNLR
jgi:hypothetical protein